MTDRVAKSRPVQSAVCCCVHRLVRCRSLKIVIVKIMITAGVPAIVWVMRFVSCVCFMISQHQNNLHQSRFIRIRRQKIIAHPRLRSVVTCTELYFTTIVSEEVSIARRLSKKLSRVTSNDVPIIMRPSSLGVGRILRRTLSVCLSVRPVIVTERHVAPPSELQWHTCTLRHALRAAYRRPSRPHKFLLGM